MKPLVTYGHFSGILLVFVCDRKCEKAWGMNNRPKRPIAEDEVCLQRAVVEGYYAEDFWTMVPDGELGEAPADPGTYEGDCSKPTSPVEVHNKWCVRECERCLTYLPGEPLYLHNFNQPVPNLRASVLTTRAPKLVFLVKEEDADVVKE